MQLLASFNLISNNINSIMLSKFEFKTINKIQQTSTFFFYFYLE